MKIFFPWLFYLALVGCGQSGLQSTELLVSSAGKSIMKPEGTGLYPVHVGDKMGYINVSGKLVIEPTFHRAESFSDGLAGVQSIWDPDKNVYDFIDVKGNVVLRGVNIPEMSAPKFSEGLVPVEQNGKTGFMNKEGKIVIRPQFYCEVSKGSCGCECEGGAITPFESGHSWVVKGHNHILIDRAG
ncbi:MAG: WG repeat-containing protein, partial [Fimbriimonadaceae bacterium]